MGPKDWEVGKIHDSLESNARPLKEERAVLVSGPFSCGPFRVRR